METVNNITQALKDIKNVANNDSWFRDTPHRWATASLPLAYAVASVEVVSKSSEKAGEIYNQIIEAWGNPRLKTVYDAIIAEVPDPEIEKAKYALIHPETAFLPDPNKTFKQIEGIFNRLDDVKEGFLDELTERLSIEETDFEELIKFVYLIFEFINVGFNRESDISKGKFRVIPSEKPPWLFMAIIMRTSFESNNITLERLRRVYKLRKYKGKIIDFHKVLTEQPMSRWHRRIVASGKAAKLKLKNDGVIMNAARTWYQCRVNYRSVAKYCDAQAKLGIILDPKNVDKQIRPCDDALGYIRRLPQKINK